jgi:hypothetical protein
VNPIQATIKLGDAGESVFNLRAALLFLLDRGAIKAPELLNRPSTDELSALGNGVRTEQQSGAAFEGDTRRLVLYVQLQNGLGDRLDGVVEETTADMLNRLLKRFGAFESGTDFVVRGTLKDANGNPQSGYVVIAFDRDLRRWQELGRAQTNVEGRFEIPYRYESFRQAEGIVQPEVDLVLQVARQIENDALEPIHVHEEPKPVPPVASVEIVLPVVAEPGPTEFERATALIKPLLIGQGPLIVSELQPSAAPRRPTTVGPRPFDFGDLRVEGLMAGMPRYADLQPEEINEGDVAFIVRETRLDAEVVRAWVAGARMARELAPLALGLPPQSNALSAAELLAGGWNVFYGMVRRGQAKDLDEVLVWDEAQWRAWHVLNVEGGWVEAEANDRWSRIARALSRMRLQRRIDPSRNPGHPLARVLRSVAFDFPTALLERAAEAIGEQGSERPESLHALAPDGIDGTSEAAVAVRALVRGLQLDNLTGGNVALSAVLDRAMPREGPRSHELEALAAATQDDWKGWCKAAGLDPSEGDAALPWSLQARAESLYPLSALTARIEGNALALGDDDAERLRAAAQAAPRAVEALLSGSAHEDVDAVPEEAKTIVRNIGRHLKVGFTLQAGAALYAKGITSPAAISSSGVEVVQAALGDSVPAPYVAAVVHHVTTIVVGTTAFFNTLAGAQTAPLGMQPLNQPVSAAAQQAFPTVAGIFGDLGECACRPCESVLGLPAYLADLLGFLKRIPAHTLNASTALMALRARRPDITRMPLDCPNSETEIPHIDLVIEVLEGLVGADPETSLAAARFPWTLPYSRKDVELGAWLDLAGASRDAWFAAMLGRTGNAAHEAALAAQRLGLGPDAWQAVAIPAANDDEVWRAYGFASAAAVDLLDPASGKTVRGTPLQLLGRVSVLLDRTDLGLDELRFALDTDFVKGSGTIAVSGLDGCKTSEMAVSGLSGSVLDRLHRFVRLWRGVSNVSIPVIDSALTACAQTTAPDFLTVLVRLSTHLALSRRLKVGLEVWLSLFRPLDQIRVALENGRSQTLYTALFRSPSSSAAQRNAFPEPPTAANAFTFGPISARFGAIAEAMRCPPRTLARWVHVSGSAAVASPVAYLLHDAWTYDNLTSLYRRQTLGAALMLGPAELMLMVGMTGAAVTSSSSAETFAVAMTTLLDALDVQKRSGLGIEDTARMLLPDSDRGGVALPPTSAPEWAVLKGRLVQLRRSLMEVPSKSVGTTDTEIDQALDEATEQARSWLPLESVRLLGEAMQFGLPAAIADRSRLSDALVTPVAGVSGADGRELIFMAPTEVTQYFNRPDRKDRVQAVLDRIHGLRRRIVLREALAEWTGLPMALNDALVARDLPVEVPGTNARPAEVELLSTASGGFLDPTATEVQAASTGPRVEWVYRLQRWAWLMDALHIADPASLLKVLRLTHVRSVSGPAPFSLLRVLAPTDRGGGRQPWAEWRSLLATAWLLRDGAVDPTWAVPLLRDLHAAGSSATAATWSPLATAWSLTADETRLLLDSMTPSVFEVCDPWHWWRARALLAELKPLGLDVPNWLLLCLPIVDAAMVDVARATAKGFRPARATATADRLKAAWRDALLAKATQITGKSREALYAHQLIDLEMAPCMVTTRLLQAVASVQQFVHRIFFGLEPGIGARVGTDLSEVRGQWAWMSQYRVWEANRKVFLFPENWLLPELRDDKSECFRSLEAALSGPDLTHAEAERAYGRFIDDVAQAGRIVVLGMCEDVPKASTTLTRDTPRDLYLVGRTPHQPYRYFWRVARDFGRPTTEWSPWQLIDLDVQGDHLVPFVLNGDLHIAWPNFEADARSDTTAPMRLKMAWSRLVGRRWQGVEVTRDALEVTTPPTDDERTGFAFRAIQRDELVRVVGYVRETGDSLTSVVQPSLNQGTETPLDGAVTGSTVGPFHSTLFVGVAEDGTVIDFLFRDKPNTGNGEGVGAVLRILATVWVQVGGPGQKPGFVRLAARGARYSLSLKFDSGSKAAVMGGTTVTVWVSDYGKPPPSIPELGLQVGLHIPGGATFAKFSSAKVTLASTGQGKARTATVTFVINPTTPITLEDLGIPSSENFISVAEFECTTGSARLRPPMIRERLPLLQLCSAAMGGYRGNKNTRPILLPATQAASAAIAPFREPYFLGQGFWGDGSELWLVGASSSRGDTGKPPAWYYFDGHDACVIDLVPDGTGSRRFAVAAAAYPEASDFRVDLAGGLPALAKRGNAPIRFSAGDLPALDGAGVSIDWQEQVAGDRGFDLSLPFGPYSWEVFCHAPLLIADRLGKQGRHADAEQWLRMLLDPTHGTTTWDPKAFLRFRPFREFDESDGVRRAMEALAQAKQGLPASGADAVAKLVDRWRRQAFMPFAIARGRPVAFLWRTVFAYLDNLLAWADDLYRIDTRESINEALQLYVLASQILGRRPTLVRGRQSHAAKAYDDIETLWDEFANAWIDTSRPLGNTPPGPRMPRDPAVSPFASVPMVGALYFCIPANPKVLQYWNLVEARLFNIRQCRNIEGVARTLPLLEAPIDPELLVRAVAAGLDIGEVVRGLYAPPHPYRAQVLAARALDLANEARALSAALLSALEKRDAEKLAELRSSNEIALLQRVKDIRTRQRDEADEVLRGLEASRDSAERRFRHLQKLLGKNAESPAKHQTLGDEPMVAETVSRVGSGFAAGLGGSLGLIEAELAYAEQLGVAHQLMIAAGVTKGVSGVFFLGEAVAQAYLNEPTGRVLRAFGLAASTVGDALDVASRGHQNVASLESTRAGHQRRRDEWAHQSNQALAELRSIDRQILAQEIRRDIANRELRNHEAQIAESRQVDAFLREKFSNADLYEWMQGELVSLLKSTYRMALALARRAESAHARELGAAPFNLIGNDHWSDRRSGLLAAEQLIHDLKKLDLRQLELHRREHEMTKHVSLRMLDPQALIKLITEGACDFELPEWLFDMDMPGHYLRRLKTVGLSLPCVAGPYAAVNCKLTLMKSVVRASNDASGDYNITSDDDPRAIVRYGAVESIVTSTGRDDNGVFEAGLRDDRYLPFEHAGAQSTWRLELTAAAPQFDPATISDVVLHVRYTARDGGKSLANAARSALDYRWVTPAESLSAMISLRTDFPAEWARASDARPSAITVSVEPHSHLPYWMRAARISVAPATGATDVEAVALLHRTGADGPLRSTPITANLQNRTLSLSSLSNWSELVDVVVFLPVRR